MSNGTRGAGQGLFPGLPRLRRTWSSLRSALLLPAAELARIDSMQTPMALLERKAGRIEGELDDAEGNAHEAVKRQTQRPGQETFTYSGGPFFTAKPSVTSKSF